MAPCHHHISIPLFHLNYPYRSPRLAHSRPTLENRAPAGAMFSLGNSTVQKDYRPVDSHYREVEALSSALSLRLASSVAGALLLRQDGNSQPGASPSKPPPSEKLDEPGGPQGSSDSDAAGEGDGPVDARYQEYYDSVSSIIEANNALLDTIGGCLSEIASFHGVDEEFGNMPNDAYEAWAGLFDSTAKEEEDGPAEVPLQGARGLDEDDDDEDEDDEDDKDDEDDGDEDEDNDDGSLFSLFNDTPPEKNAEPDDAAEVAQLLFNISTMEEDGGPAGAISEGPQGLDKCDDDPLCSLFNETSPNKDEECDEDADASSSNITTDETDDSSDETEILYQEDDLADQEKFSRIIHALIEHQLSKTEANSQRAQVPPAKINHFEEAMREEALILASMAGPGATAAETKRIADEAEEVRQRLAAQGLESIPEGMARARARPAPLKRRRRGKGRTARALEEAEEEEEEAARVEAGERMAMEIWSQALSMDLYGTPHFEPALEGFRRIAEVGEKAFAELGGKAFAELGEKALAELGEKAFAKLGEKAFAEVGDKAFAELREKAFAKLGGKALVELGDKLFGGRGPAG